MPLVCPESDEKFIVLIFENGLVLKEQMILEDILSEIGRSNDLSDFPTKLSFEEANLRLVNYNKASKQKEEKVGRQAGRQAVAPPTRHRTDDVPSLSLIGLFFFVTVNISSLFEVLYFNFAPKIIN